MKIISIVILAFFCGTPIVYAQNCIHKNLSPIINYNINISQKKVITLISTNKTGGQLQKITYRPGYLFPDAFLNCSAVRSYITNVNKKNEVSDYDYGDLIIVDLNFDGEEDIAIKYDSGGNGGPSYRFYLQNKSNRFILNEYLTNQVRSFPSTLNVKNKSITTQIHANAYQEESVTYKLDPSIHKWKIVKRIKINAN